MTALLVVPESMAESVADFVKEHSIPLYVASTDDASSSADRIVRVVCCDERLQSDSSTLYSDGWITCATARAMGAELDVGLMNMGNLLDFLNVKVRQCELGCF